MPLSCKDAARLLSEKRDRRLPWRARVSLRLHMIVCRMCKIYGAQLSAVSRICNEAGLHAEHKCPGEMDPERKQRIKDAIAKP